MRFPMNIYQGGGTSGKIISIKRNHQPNFGFFSNGDFPSRICWDFFRTALFLEKLLLRTSTQQLLFRSSYFFRADAFFFRRINSSQQLFFPNSYFYRAKLIPSSHFLRIGSSLEQLDLFGAGIFQNTYIYRRATFQKQVLLHIINFFRRAIFQKKPLFQKSIIPHYLLFLENYLFIGETFPKHVTFHRSYIFRRATF